MSRPSVSESLPSIFRGRGPGSIELIEQLQTFIRSQHFAPLILGFILLIGGALRLTGVAWDSNKHLHPDERFLTTVAYDINRPDPAQPGQASDPFRNYFDPTASPISPYTLQNMGLYVYGTLPLWLVKWAAVQIGQNTYDGIVLVGRVISALFDLGSILVLFLIGRRLYGQTVALLGCAFLSLSVLNIQQSHFFTTDTFANLFVVLVVLFALRVSEQGRWIDYAGMCAALAAGMASKLSVATLAVPVLLACGWDLARQIRMPSGGADRIIERTIIRLLTVSLLTIVLFRILQPISFQGPEFWNFSLYQPWLDDIKEQGNILAGDVDAPPWHQWTNRPALIFPLQNMLLWGQGPLLGLAAWAGFGLAAYELFWRRRWVHLLPVAYVGVTFLYHGTLWVKFMRYFLPLYPFLALFAAYLVVRAFQWLVVFQELRAQNRRTAEPQNQGAETQDPRPKTQEDPTTDDGTIELLNPGGEESEDRSQTSGAESLELRTKNQELILDDEQGADAIDGMGDQRPATSDQLPADGQAPQDITEPSSIVHRPSSQSHQSPATSHKTLLLAALPGIVILLGTLLWATAFASIYTRPHSRVAATRWMLDNIPSGSVVANEHWDDWLPLPLDDKDMFGTQQLRGIEMPMFEDDTPDKLDRVVANLSETNYIFLTSNRLYDSIPRLPMRYPMTIRYYELLFEERLGFKRVAEFTSYPTILGIPIPDQSSEESFTVYDHPRVQIYQKSPGFNPDEVRRLLGEGIDWKSVARLTPKQATKAPDLLMLPGFDRTTYSATEARLGPAPWAGLANQYPLVFWVMTLLLLWAAALPLTLIVFSRLRDRGFLLARSVSLLSASWLVWVLASVRILPFTWWSALLALIFVAVVSWAAGYARREELMRFWAAERGALLIQEGLFWGAFLLMVFVRSQNPDLWHPGMGGEKPMDTAFLNAITSSPFFPAYDPWYAGGYINYYYFGFVLVASMIHLSGVEVTTAYNLAVPTLFALTAAGACSVAGSLAIAARRVVRRDRLSRALTGARGWLAAGMLGALFVVGIGNLGQLQLLWDGLKGISELPEKPPALPEPTSSFSPFAALQDKVSELFLPASRAFDGLALMLFDGKTFNFRQEWWYWNATRVIPPGPNEAGPINEFPFFTFLFADLHAHMMALPFTILVVAICVQFVLSAAPEQQRARPEAGANRRARLRLFVLQHGVEGLALGLAALTVGSLWPTNTWDFPTYAALLGVALALQAYARHGGVIAPPMLLAAGWRFGLVVGASILLFKPFHDTSASAYFGAEAWEGSQTPLWAYLLIHGFFLFILVSYMLSEFLRRNHDLSGPARLIGLVLRRGDRLSRLWPLYQRLARPTILHELIVKLLPATGVLLAAIALLGHPVEAVALVVAGMAALLFLRQRPDAPQQLLLAMIAGSALLTAVVEVIVLKGDISRMNTVFKFYLQVWVLWGLAAAAVLPALADRILTREAAPDLSPEPGSTIPVPAPRALWGERWWLGWSILLAGCLIYPLTATPGRMRDRFEGVSMTTLDGTAYMETAVYNDQNQPIILENDREAIEWMRASIPGRPTIVEANTPLYRWGARVSIYTGMPTIIGWDWHEKQQRAVFPGDYIDRRINDVRSIYADPNAETARTLLQQYGVSYIYVGKQERIYYPTDGIAKFEQYNGQLWDKVYENADVQIYRVRAS
jgi:YYY domain-containing protein